MIMEDDDQELSGSEEDFVDPTGHTRPLMKGEVVPHVPTMYEQLDMLSRATQKARTHGR